MRLHRTINTATGETRYYCDGGRVTRTAYDLTWAMARALDCVLTTSRSNRRGQRVYTHSVEVRR